jgi:hypothetical protein
LDTKNYDEEITNMNIYDGKPANDFTDQTDKIEDRIKISIDGTDKVIKVWKATKIKNCLLDFPSWAKIILIVK